MSAATVCRKCSRLLTPQTAVRLWDGGDYCRPCVDQACPDLADYALAHDVLEECMTYDRKGARRYLLRMYAITAVVVCALAALAGSATGDLGACVVVLLSFLFCAALAAAIQTPMFLWMTKRAVPKVSVRDGNVTVCRPNQRRLRPWTFPLSNCRWYLGKVRHDGFLRGTLTPNAPAVILVYPVRWGRFEVGRCMTACGYSEEMRQLWQAFLRLAGVPEGRKPKKPGTP